MITVLATLILGPSIVCKRCNDTYSSSSVLTRPQFEQKVVKAAVRAKVKLTAADRQAMYSLVYRESRLNRNAQNSRSSAYGLGQLLNRTWKSTGILKTACPHCQITAMLIYIKNRYKSPARAWNHSRQRGFY